jgi:phage shock protein A
MSKTTRALLLTLLPALACAPAAAAPGIAEVLTPAQYFECQIAARQATVKGLEERASQVNKAGVTDADRRAAGEMARHRVTLAMHGCGQQTASALGAYGHRNAEELQTWLNANPQVKARLDALAQRVASLSSQMPAVSPSAKR